MHGNWSFSVLKYKCWSKLLHLHILKLQTIISKWRLWYIPALMFQILVNTKTWLYMEQYIKLHKTSQQIWVRKIYTKNMGITHVFCYTDLEYSHLRCNILRSICKRYTEIIHEKMNELCLRKRHNNTGLRFFNTFYV